jgi:hypothetical protein
MSFYLLILAYRPVKKIISFDELILSQEGILKLTDRVNPMCNQGEGSHV